MQVIILAGGKGTRLWPITEHLPKPMVDVSGKPFLEYLLSYYSKKNVSKVCLSVGYKNEVISSYFSNKYDDIDLVYAIEKKALGTGGAIVQSLLKLDDSDIVVTNGDTFFDVNLDDMMDFHISNESEITIAVKAMTNFDRYGTVEIDGKSKIKGFNEKIKTKEGLINCGTYIINKKIFKSLNLPEVFSLENDVLKNNLNSIEEYAFVTNGYFIDIGVHEDLEVARQEINSVIV